MKAIIIDKPNSVTIKDVNIKSPKEGEVLISHKAIGINYFDVKQYLGEKNIKYPMIPGIEASGIIEEIGPNTKGFNIGDRVVYATARYGAYSEKRVIDSKYIISLPDEIDFLTGATLSNGLTSHMLLKRIYYVKPNNYVLVQDPTSGIGQILCQLINNIGAKSIGMVDNQEDYIFAEELGYQFVIDINSGNLVDKISEYTKGEMISVIYDSIGRDADQSLSFLMRYGLFVSFDRFSKPISIESLNKNCLFATSPNLFLYKENRHELILTANEYFEDIISGKLKINIKTYNFDQIEEAHNDLIRNNMKSSAVIVL